MDIERDKRDFETALDQLDELRNSLQDILDERVLSIMEKVSSEYNSYFKDDIEEIIQEHADLEKELEDAKREIKELMVGK